jgi:hypothetical protein
MNHRDQEKSLFGDPPEISVTFMSPISLNFKKGCMGFV